MRFAVVSIVVFFLFCQVAGSEVDRIKNGLVFTMFILKHGLKKQDSYDKCLFHTMCDSDAHFILQINLKIVVLTRRTLMMLIKPRNIIPLDLTHILTVFIMSHYFWLNV